MRGGMLWRGKSQERIWHEIRLVSCERIKTPRGFEKPEGGGVVGIGNRRQLIAAAHCK
jgi:hypothetical protein